MTISVKVIAKSVSSISGIELTTFELEYPRFIHAEFMTHRLFSRNAASSRAIPVKRAIELIQNDTATPIYWGKNQPGMSAKEECDAKVIDYKLEGVNAEEGVPIFSMKQLTREEAWNVARDNAIHIARQFDAAGYHKQIVNRLMEPFSHIKVVCTATEFGNFFNLRCHKDAQPEIQELAGLMYEKMQGISSRILKPGEWHVPYYAHGYWIPRSKDNCEVDQDATTLADALAISTSCCAQVSYRKNDDSLEKAKQIYDRLIHSKPVHASPCEHQATPVSNSPDIAETPAGVTHLDRNGNCWSGNFREWIQQRQLIPDNVNNVYQP